MIKHVFLSILAVFFIAGCTAPAKVTSRWKDPSLTGPLNLKKIAVLCVHPSKYVCKRVEDEMVAQIGADRATPGYKILQEDERKQVAVVKSKLAEQGFDGAVVLKLAGARSATANAAPLTGSFVEDYDQSVSSMGDSSGSATQTIVTVETSIYTVADARLRWRGNVDLYDPTDAQKMTADIIKVVAAELKKEKLIQ